MIYKQQTLNGHLSFDTCHLSPVTCHPFPARMTSIPNRVRSDSHAPRWSQHVPSSFVPSDAEIRSMAWPPFRQSITVFSAPWTRPQAPNSTLFLLTIHPLPTRLPARLPHCKLPLFTLRSNVQSTVSITAPSPRGTILLKIKHYFFLHANIMVPTRKPPFHSLRPWYVPLATYTVTVQTFCRVLASCAVLCVFSSPDGGSAISADAITLSVRCQWNHYKNILKSKLINTLVKITHSYIVHRISYRSAQLPTPVLPSPPYLSIFPLPPVLYALFRY